METVGARIEWALKHTGMSAREASRRAELGETQLGLVITRYRKNPNAEVTLPMLLAIARGLGVVDAWLLTGRGDPFAAPATSTALTSPPALRDHPKWAELRKLAQQRADERSRTVPPWAWELVGACCVPPGISPTASFLFDLACLCAEHGSLVDAEAESHTRIKSFPSTG